MQPIRRTLVYDKNALAYAEGFRYIINQGSARSSKTFSLLQLMHDIAQKPKPRLISVVSQTLPHLRRGAIRDFLGYLITTGQYVDEDWRKGDLIYTVNNSQIEFFSVDQADKVY
jgi:phage terminase large subunit